MTTKEQERQALSKIRKILESLDEGDSYVRKAFEGCVEDAEQNIKDDAWDSFCSRYDRACQKITDQKVLIEQQDTKIERQKKTNESLVREIESMRTIIESREKSLSEAEKLEFDRLVELNKRASTIAEQKLEIMSLKAKLYDLMAKD